METILGVLLSIPLIVVILIAVIVVAISRTTNNSVKEQDELDSATTSEFDYIEEDRSTCPIGDIGCPDFHNFICDSDWSCGIGEETESL